MSNEAIYDLTAPTLDDFEHFTFRHVAELHAGTNPGFFDGTVVADAVRNIPFAAGR